MAATPATQGLSAYLTVRDGAAAIRFYCEALGAELRLRQMAQDGKRILHAELALNGSILMLADEFPEFTRAAAPRADLRRTKGLGHTRILRDPDVVRSVADWAATGAPPTPFESTLEGQLFARGAQR